MDTGAAPAPTTVSSDYFRLAYEASTSWMDSLAMESSGFITPTESTVLSQPQLRVYGLSASCLWCGCVEASDKYSHSLLTSIYVWVNSLEKMSLCKTTCICEGIARARRF
ncbi:uncharacterized protein LOC119302761 isoform X2 [Triticum dicoccoides]|uniref:uncharacterized protein LOC119302761 isoform X2 n=1 Tax=Triticum dicoccoides TaxID=85692 RepID=UPI00188EFF59|nr:uncharacterized protein LOC119302761 isoform X2 [Triticum dicoccoides]